MSNYNSNNSSSGGGLGISTVLFLIFLVLKLCNVITWSWWWVTAPLWIGAILYILIVCIVVTYYAIDDAQTTKRLKNWRNNKHGKD